MSRLDKLYEARIKSYTCVSIKEKILPNTSEGICLAAGNPYCCNCCLGSRGYQTNITRIMRELDE